MKSYLANIIARHQKKMLFAIFWLHVSLLDFINVSQRGSLFLWQENLQIKPIVLHIVIAASALAFYILISRLFAKLSQQSQQSKRAKS